MAFCSKCGVKLEDSARFCPSCGQPVYNEQNKEKGEGGGPEMRFSILPTLPTSFQAMI